MWRFGVVGGRWRVFAYNVVTFGDPCAAAILEIVLRRICQMFGRVDPEAAIKLENDRMVDDITTGGEAGQVARYMGKQLDGSTKRDGSMQQILTPGGMELKAMACTRGEDEESERLLGGAVLGLKWDTKTDRFKFNFKINTSVRKRGVPTEEDLTPATLHKLAEAVFTKKLCVSVANMQYDPFGGVSPITIRFKVLLRRLTSQEYNLGWDDILPEELIKEWKDLLIMLVNAPCIEFDRSILPEGAWAKMKIAAYADGSDIAYAAVIYAVFVDEEDHSIDVRLVTSKARIANLGAHNTPRSEMNAAVLVSRLLVSVVRASKVKPAVVIIASDSETTLRNTPAISPSGMPTELAKATTTRPRLRRSARWATTATGSGYTSRANTIQLTGPPEETPNRKI